MREILTAACAGGYEITESGIVHATGEDLPEAAFELRLTSSARGLSATMICGERGSSFPWRAIIGIVDRKGT